MLSMNLRSSFCRLLHVPKDFLITVGSVLIERTQRVWRVWLMMLLEVTVLQGMVIFKSIRITLAQCLLILCLSEQIPQHWHGLSEIYCLFKAGTYIMRAFFLLHNESNFVMYCTESVLQGSHGVLEAKCSDYDLNQYGSEFSCLIRRW